jgi:hypothetical protein
VSYGLSETKTLKVMKRLNKEDHKKYHDTVHYTQILYPRSVYLHVACNPIRHEIRKSSVPKHTTSRIWCRWQDNIKISLIETGRDGVDGIHGTQGKTKRQAVTKAEMNLRTE